MGTEKKRMSPYRLWGSTTDEAIEFESLTNDTLSGALDVIRTSFFTQESVCKAVGILSEPGAADELIELCLDAAKDGVSIVALEVETGKVVGALFNKIQLPGNGKEKSSFERFSETCKCKSSKALVDFMIDIDASYNLFQHYNVKCIFELMFIAVLPEFSKRRIGELLISSAIEICRKLKCGEQVKIPVSVKDNNSINNYDAVPNLISAIFTSIYSQKIGRKLGFETLLEVSFDKFEYDGKKYSEILDKEEKYCVLATKRIS
ncbi:PREDICTED: uncharacterized protein LOC107073050 [Polistes dominula]|uniref:Uncharacterized protein LOC107073050 n=1 Tax=Polistes dominula TaxID=743375 RepID=A0ABM1J905_POLDO|nr:PREDICTED: uncharacterized protein LOC107073050 [Polistes dominula]